MAGFFHWALVLMVVGRLPENPNFPELFAAVENVAARAVHG